MHNTRKTKIIITIGKASSTVESLVSLLNLGIDGIRFTSRFLKNDLRDEVLQNISEAERITNRQVCLILCLREGDIRVGNGNTGKTLVLSKGDEVMIVPSKLEEDCKSILCNSSNLSSLVNIGDKLLVEFGKAILTVVGFREIEEKQEPVALERKMTGIDRFKRSRPKTHKVSKMIICRSENDCTLDEQTPVNILNASSLQPDKYNHELNNIRLLEWAIMRDFDIVIYMQVRDHEDLEELWNYEIPKDAKRFLGIQSKETAEDPKGYLDKSDGCSIGRGMLGVETSHSQVTSYQKKIVKMCNAKGLPVFVSTQVLESMTLNDKPTRSEVVDAYCAVTDGVDAIVLTGETAYGKFSELAVQTLHRICLEAEQHINYKKEREIICEQIPSPMKTADGICYFAADAVEKMGAQLVVCLTKTGKTAMTVAKFKPSCMIAAITDSVKTLRYLRIVRGIYPILMENSSERDHQHLALSLLKEHKLVNPGDRVVLIGSSRDIIIEGSTSSLKIITIS